VRKVECVCLVEYGVRTEQLDGESALKGSNGFVLWFRHEGLIEEVDCVG
jgi:hypothetical protein